MDVVDELSGRGVGVAGAGRDVPPVDDAVEDDEAGDPRDLAVSPARGACDLELPLAIAWVCGGREAEQMAEGARSYGVRIRKQGFRRQKGVRATSSDEPDGTRVLREPSEQPIDG